MNETPDGGTPVTGEPSAPVAGAQKKSGRGFLWGLIAVIVAFGGGAGWQYYERSLVEAQLEETRQELTVERIRVSLSYAALAAQAAEFETARRLMSQVFTRLTELQESLPAPVAQVADRFLATRDDVITGLSRSNPQYAGVLYDMLEAFQAAAGLEEGPAAPPMEVEEPVTEVEEPGLEPEEPMTEPEPAVADSLNM